MTSKVPFFRHKWSILVVGGILGGIAGAAYVLVSKPIYQARAQILVTASQNSGAGLALLGTQTATPLSVLSGLLKSDAITHQLAQDLSLSEKEVRASWGTVTNPDVSQIELTAERTDKEQALSLLDKAITHAKSLQQTGGTTNAKVRAQQLRTLLAEKEKQYEVALSELSNAWTTSRGPISGDLGSVVDLDVELSKARATLQAANETLNELTNRKKRAISDPELPKTGALESLRKSLREAEQQFAQAKETLGPDSPQFRAAKAVRDNAAALYQRELQKSVANETVNLDRKISEAQSERSVAEWQVAFLERITRNAPKQSLLMKSKWEAVQTIQDSLADMRSQWEVAKIDADVEQVQWTVLSEPTVMERPVNKRYVRYPAVGAILGLAVSYILAALASGGRSNG